MNVKELNIVEKSNYLSYGCHTENKGKKEDRGENISTLFKHKGKSHIKEERQQMFRVE